MANRRAKAIKADKERSGARSLQRYRYVDLEKLERYDIPQFKPEEGTNFIAIVPPNNDAHVDDEYLPMFCREVKVHRYIGVNNRAFVCMHELREHFGDPDNLPKLGEPCGVCEKREELKAAEGNPAVIKSLYPETRELFFVVDTKTLPKGASTAEMAKAGLKVQWWDASSGVKDRIVNASYDPRAKEPEFDVADPDDGRNIIFERSKAGSNGYKCEDFKTEEREPIPDEWLDQVPFEFDDILVFPEYGDVVVEVQGMPTKPTDDDKPTGRGSRRRQRRERDAESSSGGDVQDSSEPVDEGGDDASDTPDDTPAEQEEEKPIPAGDKLAGIKARIAAQKQQNAAKQATEEPAKRTRRSRK